jgi:hypothetical protein
MLAAVNGKDQGHMTIETTLSSAHISTIKSAEI